MIIAFKDIQPLIPGYVFNDFGQLTGQYVHADQIVCESENGRVRIWLNQEAFEAKDPEKLICDYDQEELRRYNGGRG
ncbi:MAG: hypothetical protein LAO21_01955 [Acidobacteriia bacterium]|nr:hypothetical protein [Terriglobia bacterium]